MNPSKVQAYVRGIIDGTVEFNDDVVEILYFASDQYYNINADRPTEILFTDSEFDQLVLKLKEQNPNHPFFAQVGSDVRGSKIDLPYQLGSLDQLDLGGDVVRWILTNKWFDQLFCITDKADGTSALIIYGRGGLLQIAYSRGNGIQGADITRHIKHMACVPKKMPYPCAVRVEVVLDELVFQEFTSQAQINGQRIFKNARNYVAGRMNAIESPKWFYDNVRVVGTSVIDPESGKQQQLDFMKNGGYEIPYFVMKKGSELNDDFLTNHILERKREVSYAIDGIVIDIDDNDIRTSLHRKSSSLNPMFSKKFKVGGEDNFAVTTVVAVHWEPSKDGYLKPRIEIQPVELSGVTITFCTGFNAGFIKSNFIGPGAVVQVTRRGDVIPYLEKVLSPMPVENMK